MEAGNEVPKFDARLADGVAYFEQMLEIMPDDRTTLEFLVVAYDQLGQHEKGQKSLVSLTKLLIREGDTAALAGLLPRLEVSDYEPAKALFLKVSTMTGPAPDLTPESPKELTASERAAAALASERVLVEILRDEGVLSAEVFEQTLGMLSATPTDGRLFLISALQILEKENFPVFEKATEFLADRFGAPPIPLGAFEPVKGLFAPYAETTLRLKGAVPFAKLGDLTLIAVLNPADEELRAELEKAGPCRFYLADPSAVEAALAKVYGGAA